MLAAAHVERASLHHVGFLHLVRLCWCISACKPSAQYNLELTILLAGVSRICIVMTNPALPDPELCLTLS